MVIAVVGLWTGAVDLQRGWAWPDPVAVDLATFLAAPPLSPHVEITDARVCFRGEIAVTGTGSYRRAELPLCAVSDGAGTARLSSADADLLDAASSVIEADGALRMAETNLALAESDPSYRAFLLDKGMGLPDVGVQRDELEAALQAADRVGVAPRTYAGWVIDGTLQHHHEPATTWAWVRVGVGGAFALLFFVALFGELTGRGASQSQGA